MKENEFEILGFEENNTEQYEIKDWSDYVLVVEKQIGVEENKNTGMTKYIYDIYYMIHDEPFPGNGFFVTTDKNAREETLDEWLYKNVYHKYNSEFIEIRNIKEIKAQ